VNYKVINLKKGTKVTVIGDIHEHEYQFTEMVNLIKPSSDNILVSVGDIYDKGFGDYQAENIIKQLKKLNENKSAFVVRGNHEEKRIKNKTCDPWLQSQPRVITFVFSNNTRLTIMHAGVSPNHTSDDLENNVEVMYIRDLDEKGDYIPLIYKMIDGQKKLRPVKQGKAWHEFYDGRFGYIIAGHHSQDDGIVKFYKFSANVDTRCFDTGVLSAIVYSENGKDDVLQVTGDAANKNGRLYR
jgi:predicted phosphodiesterase